MAFVAVLAGAFGAHGLKGTLTAYEMDIFQTGVQYQMMHALGLVLIGLLKQTSTDSRLTLAAILMLLGIVLFSGSLYTLSLGGSRWLGMITPAGGIAFLVAWLLVSLSFLRQKPN
jgi:uncharacterized membrane protein YgdD (TMEM256/DUF423 family)